MVVNYSCTHSFTFRFLLFFLSDFLFLTKTYYINMMYLPKCIVLNSRFIFKLFNAPLTRSISKIIIIIRFNNNIKIYTAYIYTKRKNKLYFNMKQAAAVITVLIFKYKFILYG